MNRRLIVITYVFLWIILSIVFIWSRGYRIKSLDSIYNFSNLKIQSSGSAKPNILTAIFKSRFHYFSGVAIASNLKVSRGNELLAFRLKPVNSDTWYFTTEIDGEEINKYGLIEIKFPQIRFSKNREYLFEIEVINKVSGAHRKVDYGNLELIGRHTLSSEQFRYDHELIFEYIALKITNIISDRIVILTLFILLFPLCIFIGINKYRHNYAPLILIMIFISLFEPFVLQGKNDSLIFSILIAWIIVGIKSEISSSIFLFLSGIYILLGLLLEFTGQEILRNSIWVWVYLYIFTGTFFKYFEKMKIFKANYSLYDFLTYVLSLFPSEVTIIVNNILLQSKSKIKFKDNIHRLVFHEKYSIMKTKLNSFYKRNESILSKIPKVIKIIILWIISLNIIKDFKNYYYFYKNYFIENAISEFLIKTGYLILIYGLISFAVCFLLGKLFQKIKKYLLFIWLILLIIGGKSIFNKTTANFRDNIKIWTVTPNNITDIWVDVTIRGVNFTDNINGGFVRVNGQDQRVISWKDKEIVFRTDPTKTATGYLEVYVTDKKKSSNKYYIEYHFNR